MSRPYKQKTINKIINNATMNDFYNRLKLIALSMYEWKGFPDKINTRFLEKQLYNNGLCCIYDDEDYGLMIAQCSSNNYLNIYDDPVEVTTISSCANYKPKTLKVGVECILIRNNIEMIPTDEFINLFAYRLYETQRSTDTNIILQKFPFIILCDNKQLLTFQKLFEDIKENEPLIYAEKNLNLESIKTLETKVPFVADKLTIQKHEIWNEALTFLGLNNANTDKKERLITDEANANNELIEMMSEVMLNQRKEACKEINKMFGEKYKFDVSVNLRTFNKKELSLDEGGDSIG